MVRLILLTFGVLGWAWYELSGGAQFQPGQNGVTLLAVPDVTETPLPKADAREEMVARSTPGDLNAVIQPAVASQVERVKTSYVTQAAAVVTPAVMTSNTVAAAAPATLDVTEAPVDYREVTASRVNLRRGPSTSHNVLTQLLRGQEVEIIDDNGAGWVKLRALQGDDIGWMSDDFLVAVN